MAARDLANRQQKSFKTSAPKGSRLADGYVDRAREREAAESDERAERIKALEELLKNEEIDQDTSNMVFDPDQDLATKCALRRSYRALYKPLEGQCILEYRLKDPC